MELINGVRPDIIISDISMPQMDGLSMIASVKSQFPGLEIIILTGAVLIALSIGIPIWSSLPIQSYRLVVLPAIVWFSSLAQNLSHIHFARLRSDLGQFIETNMSIKFEAIRNISLVLRNVNMIKEALIHKVTIALGVIRGQCFVLI